jgi:hypothetical protein
MQTIEDKLQRREEVRGYSLIFAIGHSPAFLTCATTITIIESPLISTMIVSESQMIIQKNFLSFFVS